jgi:hypothetical protein
LENVFVQITPPTKLAFPTTSAYNIVGIALIFTWK